MTIQTASGTIERNGVRLYYEKAGRGPAIVLVPGGPQDAGVFGDLANALAETNTVISYDPRGNSRSTLEDLSKDQDVDLHGDDLAALIDAVANGAAHLFGTSGGAQIAFSVAARYPEKVISLVAHEPPTVFILPDAKDAIAADQAIVDVYREHGVEAGIGAFFGMAEMDGGHDQSEPDMEGELDGMEDDETMKRVMGNFEYFLAHGLMPLSAYLPDIDALKASGIPITIGIGATSTQATMREISERLAEALDAALVTFPDDHTGFTSDPQGFANVLKTVLAN